MILTDSALRIRMKQEIHDKRFALIRNYVKNYEGVPPAADLNALDAQLERIDGPLPHGEFCPRCYFQDGSQASPMSATGSDPGAFVRVFCGQCGFEDFRPSQSSSLLFG
jgi:hypothetical protein